MVLLKRRVLLSLIYALTLFEIIAALYDFKCPKGKRIAGRKNCQVCPDGQYMPEENSSKTCFICRTCDKDLGSEIIKPCSKTENRICRCRAGFIPWESDSASCKCNVGFGLKNGECHECEDGYFSNTVNSPCSKWKGCKSGVKVNGTKTLDVICNEDPVVAPATSNTNFSVTTHFTTHPAVTRVQTKQASQRPTNTFSRGQGKTNSEKPLTPSIESSGMTVLLTLGIVGLILLTVVTCKFSIIPCRQTDMHTAEKTTDQEYPRPVEESGDPLLKQKPVEP